MAREAPNMHVMSSFRLTGEDIFPKQPLLLYMLSLGCVPFACGLKFYAGRSTSLSTRENRRVLFA